jgi:hypothetical protein
LADGALVVGSTAQVSGEKIKAAAARCNAGLIIV